MNEGVIRTEEVLQCPLCSNEERRILYSGLRDRLFGAPGEWTLKECCRCMLVFLDPRPKEDEIGKAYKTYYTHQPQPIQANILLRRLWRIARNGYLERKFGYRRVDSPAWGRWVAPWLTCIRRGDRCWMAWSCTFRPRHLVRVCST